MKNLSKKDFEQLYIIVQSLTDKTIEHLTTLKTQSVDERKFVSIHENYNSSGNLSEFLRGSLFMECLIKDTWTFKDHIDFKVNEYSKLTSTLNVQNYMAVSAAMSEETQERQTPSQHLFSAKLYKVLMEESSVEKICEELDIDIEHLPEVISYRSGVDSLQEYLD